MAKNKSLGKRDGQKVNPQFICGDCTKQRLDEMEGVINQMNKHRSSEEQIQISNNMRTLLRHLEKGEVHYMTPMAVPSVMTNRPPELVITLKTFLKGEERLWIVYHKEKKSYTWKVACNSKGALFSDFSIHSCDALVSLS